MILLTSGVIITFGLFMSAFLLLYVKKQVVFFKYDLSAAFMILSLGFGFYFKYLTLTAILSILVLLVLCYLFYTKAKGGLQVAISGIVLFLFLIALHIHAIPGFNNPIVIDGYRFSENAVDYKKYFNLDKTLYGIFIFYFGHQLITSRKELLRVLRISIPIAIITTAIVGTGGYLSNFLTIDIKFDTLSQEVFILWFLSNLFLTCFAEEALFRGFLQKHLSNFLNGRVPYANYVALLLVSVLFGLSHFGAGSIAFVVLATITAIGYGYAYLKTERLEASILCHLFLNTFHLLFLTYPMLKA